jgi:hypothetical protein
MVLLQANSKYILPSVRFGFVGHWRQLCKRMTSFAFLQQFLLRIVIQPVYNMHIGIQPVYNMRIVIQPLYNMRSNKIDISEKRISHTTNVQRLKDEQFLF